MLNQPYSFSERSTDLRDFAAGKSQRVESVAFCIAFGLDCMGLQSSKVNNNTAETWSIPPSGKNALCGHWISDFFITYFLLDSDAAKKLFLFSLLCLAPPEAAPELHGGGPRSRGARLVPAGRGARRPPVGGPVSVHLVSHRPPAGARGSAWSGPGEEREDVLSAL